MVKVRIWWVSVRVAVGLGGAIRRDVAAAARAAGRWGLDPVAVAVGRGRVIGAAVVRRFGAGE